MGGYSSSGMGRYASSGDDGYSSRQTGQGASRASYYGGRGGLGGRDESAGYGRAASGLGTGAGQSGMGGAGEGYASSDDEHESGLRPSATVAQTSLPREVAGAHKDARGLAANIEHLKEMLASDKHAAEPRVHEAVKNVADHMKQVEQRLHDLKVRANSEAQSGFSRTTGPQAVAAHSLGSSCARCGYSGASSRY
ncbi:hypothetical protein BMF94_4358 [Rhodotorula taiwanensis]|uniref:Uncharacterized protein n=1 Tax=Rhodotorula taiwanensis TaxID=741276 RepID=A0A2S5B6X4_9BASI|nr:hypothetical protein BMF94_4358 [Rhodotorula taiwanensis]